MRISGVLSSIYGILVVILILAVSLGFRMSAAVPRVHSVAVLPLDFCGRLRIFRSMHLLAALHLSLYGLLRGISSGRCLEWISSKLCKRRNRSLTFLWGS